MEENLYDNDIINVKSVAASIGGENDIGDYLSDRGIEAIENIIASKNIEFINNKSLIESVNKKIQIYIFLVTHFVGEQQRVRLGAPILFKNLNLRIFNDY